MEWLIGMGAGRHAEERSDTKGRVWEVDETVDVLERQQVR